MCSIGHFIPSFLRHAAAFGYDCIWVDMEHRLIDEREVQLMLTHCHLADIDCMLRPPTLEKSRLYRYLEDGATGLMIPFVSTAEKARTLVDAVKFPPLGDRGLDSGAGLDGDYFQHDLDTYVSHANQETFLFVQIETPQAVQNVDEIASVEGIDGLFVGPGDLSLRIARCNNTKLTLDSVIDQVAETAARHGKAWGMPGANADRVQQLYEKGAQFIAYGGEYITIKNMLEASSAELDEIYGK